MKRTVAVAQANHRPNRILIVLAAAWLIAALALGSAAVESRGTPADRPAPIAGAAQP
jgi:hypothetical protein